MHQSGSIPFNWLTLLCCRRPDARLQPILSSLWVGGRPGGAFGLLLRAQPGVSRLRWPCLGLPLRSPRLRGLQGETEIRQWLWCNWLSDLKFSDMSSVVSYRHIPESCSHFFNSLSIFLSIFINCFLSMSPLRLRQAKDHKQAFDDTLTGIIIINDICLFFWEKSTHQIVKSTASATMPSRIRLITAFTLGWSIIAKLIVYWTRAAQSGVNKGTKGQSQYSLTRAQKCSVSIWPQKEPAEAETVWKLFAREREDNYQEVMKLSQVKETKCSLASFRLEKNVQN